MLSVYRAGYAGQAIDVYKAFSHSRSSKWPRGVGRAEIAIFVGTDVKSGSERVRGGGPGTHSWEEMECGFKTQAAPLSVMVCAVLPASLPWERARHEAGAGAGSFLLGS